MDINLVLAFVISLLSLFSILLALCMPILVILAIVYVYKRIRKDFT